MILTGRTRGLIGIKDIPHYIVSILGGAVDGCNVGVEVLGER